MKALRSDRSKDGLLVLRSERLETLGFQHAFSTAVGPGHEPFDLSAPGTSRIGIAPGTSQAALDRFVDAIGGPGRLALPHQVHGAEVCAAENASGREADAVIAESLGASEPGEPWLAAIRTADCVPILLACPRSGRVAAVHAGWRGLVSNVLGATVRAMQTLGSDPDELEAAIGPAIDLDSFEIGVEVAEQFRGSGLASAIAERSPRPHADLHAAARIRLQDAGVRESAIDGLPLSTTSSRDFFSHRRDSGRTGRHMAAIRPRFRVEDRHRI